MFLVRYDAAARQACTWTTHFTWRLLEHHHRKWNDAAAVITDIGHNARTLLNSSSARRRHAPETKSRPPRHQSGGRLGHGERLESFQDGTASDQLHSGKSFKASHHLAVWTALTTEVLELSAIRNRWCRSASQRLATICASHPKPTPC
jgi:hypothetical protein